ncbi:hypothetical protein [Psychrobacter sp. W2-37-MNA-CIBAN-0211]|uniref:hypothetical protein n=1 Tax=Psychrobacter sp. W2-37-MNA-CIBAN-0211 TaxID=3140443 RepID=UPI003333332F
MSKATADDVWAAAKLIWENTAKISDRDLIEQLTISFGELAPKSNGTISKRRKKEDWEKSKDVKQANAKRARQKLEPKQAESTENRNQNDSVLKVVPSTTNRAQILEPSPHLEPKSPTLTEITDTIIMNEKQRAAIIIKSRKRVAQVGELTDEGLKVALSVIQHMDSEDGEQIQKAIVISDALATTVDKLSRSIKLIAEIEMPLCGITPDDFTQSDRERRMGALDSFGNISEEEDAARALKQPLLMARLARLKEREDDPNFGRATDPNLEDDEGYEGDDEDYDDIDYTSLDD